MLSGWWHVTYVSLYVCDVCHCVCGVSMHVYVHSCVCICTYTQINDCVYNYNIKKMKNTQSTINQITKEKKIHASTKQLHNNNTK